ncbi:MAG: hypothetical protein M0036_12475 [Desulfobacteraceae bacterium]|nr:hypothetical protein [Desulfobacteraceae bacterium]
MMLRFGPVALVLIVALLATPVEAQLKKPLAQDLARHGDGTSLLPEVVALSLHVVRNGGLERRTFTADELAAMTEITVDGYVNGVVVLTTTPLTVTVGDQPMNTILDQGDGSHKLKYYGTMASQRFWDTYLPRGCAGSPEARIKGRYSCFSRVPWDTLSKNQTFEIGFGLKSAHQIWTVRQDVPLQVVLAPPQQVERPGPMFYYLGKDLGRFKQRSTDFNDRLEAIQAGIKGVEAIASSVMVEQVNILDCQGPSNAYTCPNKAELWINSEMFWKESLPELRIIAEHEAMHLLSDRLGFSDNVHIRDLFAELMSANTSSAERAAVKAAGYLSNSQTANPISAGNHLLLDFINESNFIRGMNGGHAQESVDEFCASFLHTLFYIDRLAQLLGQPIITQQHSLVTLSVAEQAQLLEAYRRILETMGQEIEKLDIPEPVKTLFQSGLAAARQAESTLETHRAGAAAPHRRQPS